MEKTNEVKKAARVLGRRGGAATLKKYGAEKLKKWGKRGGKFGKLGGRPRKSETAKRKTRQPKAGAKE